MLEAYKEFWKNYFNFSGVMSRKSFWLNVLIFWIIYFCFIFCAITTIYIPSFLLLTFIFVIYFIVTIIPNISMQIRRLHDTNESGWLLLIYLIPFLGLIILFILFLFPRVTENNRYINRLSAQTAENTKDYSNIVYWIVIFTMIILILILNGIYVSEL